MIPRKLVKHFFQLGLGIRLARYPAGNVRRRQAFAGGHVEGAGPALHGPTLHGAVLHGPALHGHGHDRRSA